jgi:hypothetical protein
MTLKALQKTQVEEQNNFLFPIGKTKPRKFLTFAHCIIPAHLLQRQYLVYILVLYNLSMSDYMQC